MTDMTDRKGLYIEEKILKYLGKPGSLTLLYEMYRRCNRELPGYTKEIAFDLLAFRFRMYAEVLKTGGYDGRTGWG
jgi:hypothetical protein